MNEKTMNYETPKPESPVYETENIRRIVENFPVFGFTGFLYSIFFCFLVMISELDLHVALHLAAGLEHLGHDGGGVGAVRKGDAHLLGDKADDRLRNALHLVGGGLHFGGAVGAANFDVVDLFHSKYSFFMLLIICRFIQKAIPAFPWEHAHTPTACADVGR